MDLRLDLSGLSEEAASIALETVLDAHVDWQQAEGVPRPKRSVGDLLAVKLRELDGRLGRWRAADVLAAVPRLFPPDLAPEAADVEEVLRAARRYLAWLDASGPRDGDPLDLLAEALELVGDELRRHARKHQPLQRRPGDLVLDLLELTDVLPPVTLPPAGTLAEEAGRAPLLRRVTELVTWVGDGRRLTQKGNLRLADGRELVALLGTGDEMDAEIRGRVLKTRSTTELPTLDLVFRLARTADVVAARKGMLLVTGRGRRLGQDPVADWHDLADALLVHGVVGYRWEERPYSPVWGPDLDEAMSDVLLDLLVLGLPRPIAAVADECWGVLTSRFDLGALEPLRRETERHTVEWALRGWLDRLADLGAVRVTEETRGRDRWGLERQEGGRVALTGLGVALAHRHAVQRGYDAPAVGVLAAAEPDMLEIGLAVMAPERAAAELVTWLETRDAGHAELRRAVAAGALPEDAAAVVAALRSLGAAAVPALDVIAAAHPDGGVAKDARRALFRLRTAGIG